MKNEMQISMGYDGGIVLFDPEVFCDFLEEIGATSGNIFDLFIKDKKIGDHAINQGYIIPMYPIDEDDYNFVKMKSSSSDQSPVFEYKGFPLTVKSGILVGADIFSLIGWEHDFFRNYINNYKKKSKVNDMIEIESGLYSVDILGLKKNDSKTYGLIFNPVDRLPMLPANASSSSFDFNLN